MFLLNIVYFNFWCSPSFGVISCKASGLFEGTVRKFAIRSFDDDMGSGHFFGMEPPVISCCLFKCQFIILEVVFAHKDIESVTGNIVEGFGFCLCFGTLFAGIMLFDITILGKLFLDLAQITFCTGNIECVGYGFQMLDFGFGIGKLFVQSFFRTFELAIAVKIFLEFSCGVRVGSRGMVISSLV